MRAAWPGQVNTLPRPNSSARDVPLQTSLYMEVAPGSDGAGRLDPIDIATLRVTLARAGGKAIVLLDHGGKWMGGATGQIFGPSPPPAGSSLDDIAFSPPNRGVYLVPPAPLDPATAYSVTVECRSLSGASLPPDGIGWKFTTRAAPPADPVRLTGDVARRVRWEGQIFAGLSKPNFDSSRLFHQLDS